MSEAPVHSRPETHITVPFLAFSMLLLAILIPDVILRKPVMSPEMRQGWVMHHQAVQNLLFAQQFVVSHLSAPVTSWGPELTYGEVGHGVWFAQGNLQTAEFAPGKGSEFNLEIVSTAPEGESSFWKVLFIPGAPKPLYLRIDSYQEGDYSYALARAGVPTAKP